jgi:hypothetical protein
VIHLSACRLETPASKLAGATIRFQFCLLQNGWTKLPLQIRRSPMESAGGRIWPGISARPGSEKERSKGKTICSTRKLAIQLPKIAPCGQINMSFISMILTRLIGLPLHFMTANPIRFSATIYQKQ